MNLKIVKISDWTWKISDSSLLEPWFANFAKSPDSLSPPAEKIKENLIRTVWKIGKYYLKYSRPAAKTGILRQILFPTAKREYQISKFIEYKGINSVKTLGWASSGKGKSILLTESLEGFVNARNFWFSTACREPKIKELFLMKLSEFVGTLINKGVGHADFHLGNLLIRPDDCCFALVDLYKIKMRKGVLKQKEKIKMLGILASMRGELSDKEAFSFLVKIGAEICGPEKLWADLLSAAAKESLNLWKKRKKNIFQNGRLVSAFSSPETLLIVKKDICGTELASKNDFNEPEKKFSVRYMNKDDGKKIWEESLFLDLNRIRHYGPIAIRIEKDKLKCALFYEKSPPKEHSFHLSIEEIIKRASIAKIKRCDIEKIISGKKI